MAKNFIPSEDDVFAQMMATSRSFADMPEAPNERSSQPTIKRTSKPIQPDPIESTTFQYPPEKKTTANNQPKSSSAVRSVKDSLSEPYKKREKPTEAYIPRKYGLTKELIKALDRRTYLDDSLDLSGHVRAALEEYLAEDLKAIRAGKI